jgi:hypothetical protein
MVVGDGSYACLTGASAGDGGALGRLRCWVLATVFPVPTGLALTWPRNDLLPAVRRALTKSQDALLCA